MIRFRRNQTRRKAFCYCTTCIVYVILSKNASFIFALFSKAGAKVRSLKVTTKCFRKFFLKVFFSLSYLLKLFQQERRPKQKKILFCEPDCKDKDFLASLPNFQRSFFLKVKPHKSNPTGALSTFQENTLSLLQSGCKSRSFCHTKQEDHTLFLEKKGAKRLKALGIKG